MNVFHWHLVDDQGWRVETKKYPLLTQIGSKRKSTQIGPKQWESRIQSGEPHEGFWKGDLDLATNAAKKGYEIVNSLHSSTYLDYAYKAIPLKKAYDFNPIPQGLDQKFQHKIIGLGTQMRGEWIPTNGEMHYQVFRRIAAYAEVGWIKNSNKNYHRFLLGLPLLKERWKAKDIYFAEQPE